MELKIKHEPLYKLEVDIQDPIKSLTDTTFSKLINFIMINTESEVLKRTGQLNPTSELEDICKKHFLHYPM